MTWSLSQNTSNVNRVDIGERARLGPLRNQKSTTLGCDFELKGEGMSAVRGASASHARSSSTRSKAPAWAAVGTPFPPRHAEQKASHRAPFSNSSADREADTIGRRAGASAAGGAHEPSTVSHPLATRRQRPSRVLNLLAVGCARVCPHVTRFPRLRIALAVTGAGTAAAPPSRGAGGRSRAAGAWQTFSFPAEMNAADAGCQIIIFVEELLMKLRPRQSAGGG